MVWSSNNSKVVSVSNGQIKALSEGSATITAKTKEGSKIATCKVIVIKKLVKAINFDKSDSTYYLNNYSAININATVSPSDANNKGITWKSNNEKVAKVTNGKVNFINPGKAIITATAKGGSGVSKSITVTLKKKIIIIEGASNCT